VAGVSRSWVLLAVAIGGALGTVTRYELALAEPVRAGHFPWATFGVNVAGSLLLGVVLAVVADAWGPSRIVRPLVAVGFCGGLTTFSTWMVESVLLVRDGAVGVALVSLLVGVAAGFAAVSLGVFATRSVLHRREALVFDPRDDD
jgi:CrcB protein